MLGFGVRQREDRGSIGGMGDKVAWGERRVGGCVGGKTEGGSVFNKVGVKQEGKYRPGRPNERAGKRLFGATL